MNSQIKFFVECPLSAVCFSLVLRCYSCCGLIPFLSFMMARVGDSHDVKLISSFRSLFNLNSMGCKFIYFELHPLEHVAWLLLRCLLLNLQSSKQTRAAFTRPWKVSGHRCIPSFCKKRRKGTDEHIYLLEYTLIRREVRYILMHTSRNLPIPFRVGIL